jgi:hypothetical protein
MDSSVFAAVSDRDLEGGGHATKRDPSIASLRIHEPAEQFD